MDKFKKENDELLKIRFMIKALSEVKVPPKTETSPKCNHLFLGQSSTLPENVI